VDERRMDEDQVMSTIPENPKTGQVFDLGPPIINEKMSVIVCEVKLDEVIVLGLDGKVRKIKR
jgi:hypothetical protein